MINFEGKIKNKAKICFYDENTVFVKYDSFNSSITFLNEIDIKERESFGKLLLYASYLIRNIVNAGFVSRDAQVIIAEVLSQFDIEDYSFKKLILLSEPLECKKERGFVTEIEITNGNFNNFKLKPFGFNLWNIFSKDLPVYASYSILYFLKYFLSENSNDIEFKQKLINVTHYCGMLIMNNSLNVANQKQYMINAAMSQFEF